MRQSLWVLAAWISLANGAAFAQKSQPAQANATWKKSVVDKVFRSEGVAVADFNKDGKLDLFVGDVWYEAPDWKRHVIRREKPYDPHAYSESFACFADDFNGDGYPDVIVIPFPGKQCPWYENPGKSGGKWKEHILASSACNETPIFVDLFKTGKKVLVMGWQPSGKDNMGQMCYFVPGKDPADLWIKHSISGPSAKGKEVPGTRRFSHGLGHGDVNGDGRLDVITTGGWWEQPEKLTDKPWKFHPANLGPACADMYALDIDGNGKNDVVSTSAHGYGFWWFQQKEGKDGSPSFSQKNIFLTPADRAAKSAEAAKLSKEERAIFEALRKIRDDERKAQVPLNESLIDLARIPATGFRPIDKRKRFVQIEITGKSAPDVAKELVKQAQAKEPLLPGDELGFVVLESDKGKQLAAVIGPGSFSLTSQTHALIHTDIDGDGTPDFVTGRRWWAHGPKGDPGSADPAYVYWFQAKKGKDGKLEYTPHQIDDDSGIGTQFVVIDMDGDGLPDIVVSNKKGVFILQQARPDAASRQQPGRKE